MDALLNFKIKIESQNLEKFVSETIDHIKINIKMPNPSQEPPVSSKAQNNDVLCTFKIMIESQNLDHGCMKDQ